MTTKLEKFNQLQLKKDLPDIRPGDTVKVHQKVKEKEKERIQVFEGVVIARKHGKGISATITVRKISSGVGVEKVFPLHSPNIEKIDLVRKGKVRRAKLYYLRTAKGQKAKLKRKDFAKVIPEEESKVVGKKPVEEVKPASAPADAESSAFGRRSGLRPTKSAGKEEAKGEKQEEEIKEEPKKQAQVA